MGRSILFVDGHPLYREGLVHGLRGAMVDCRIVARSGVADGDLALAQSFDLCLCEQRLPDGAGLAFLARARRRSPTLATGLLTSDVTDELCRAVRDGGGIACLSKDRDGPSLADAIRSCLAGETVFDGRAPARVLTDRRRDIVRMAAQGWGDKRICSHLAITESGVRGHWHHIFGRLGANNRTEAVTKALQLRLI